jgi:hypothetical protein
MTVGIVARLIALLLLLFMGACFLVAPDKANQWFGTWSTQRQSAIMLRVFGLVWIIAILLFAALIYRALSGPVRTAVTLNSLAAASNGLQPASLRFGNGVFENYGAKTRTSKRSHSGRSKLDGPNVFWNEVEWNCVLERL